MCCSNLYIAEAPALHGGAAQLMVVDLLVVLGEVLIDDRFRDVTNYRWIATQLDITVEEAKKLYGQE